MALLLAPATEELLNGPGDFEDRLMGTVELSARVLAGSTATWIERDDALICHSDRGSQCHQHPLSSRSKLEGRLLPAFLPYDGRRRRADARCRIDRSTSNG
ncbi:MAG: hypothetical protein EOP82_15550 [Variovorax sp.]|nr:MAG: hypothetical protein EOP82_15550 [Variovorax sp.]